MDSGDSQGRAAPKQPGPLALGGVRAFAAVWFGQLVSGLGTGLSGVGFGVWLYQQTGSATVFALNGLLYVVPIAVLGSVAGALVDRWDRRRVLFAADAGHALATLAVLLLLSADRLAVWHLYTATAAHAILRAFQEPAFAASVSLLVPSRHLVRAAGLSQVNLAVGRLAAPLLAGFLVVAVGLEGIVLIDLATYLVAVAAVLAVRIPRPPAPALPAAQAHRAAGSHGSQRSLWRETAFGWRYLAARPGLLHLVLAGALRNFFVNAAAVLTVPMVLSFADAAAAGAVLSAGGLGLLAGGVLVGTWGGPRRRVAGWLGATALEGTALVLAGWLPNATVVAAGQFLRSIGFAGGAAALRALAQSKVAPEVQGRVFGAVGVLSLLAEAPAYPVGGFLADRVFGPLAAEGGALTVALGPLIAAGPERGIGLLHVLMGIGLLATAAAAAMDPRIRRLEDELPDAVPEPERQPAATRKPASVPLVPAT